MVMDIGVLVSMNSWLSALKKPGNGYKYKNHLYLNCTLIP